MKSNNQPADPAPMLAKLATLSKSFVSSAGAGLAGG
jgi:hypothetical protein